jgi:cytochrome c-type biogenesis protein
MVDITVWIAFLAGLASFLSPCVFPLVPAYVGYLGGRSVAGATGQETGRFSTFTHGLAFVLGFSAVFITVGLALTAISNLMYTITPILSKIGGVIVIIFGLHMTGLVRIPFLEYDLRPQSKMDRRRSYISSALMGVFFSAGWSPCVGPTLGAIMTMAATGGSISQALILLVFYSAGLAVPFLLAALGVGWVTQVLRKYQKALQIIQVVMGVVLIIMGILLVAGVLAELSRIGPFVDFGI